MRDYDEPQFQLRRKVFHALDTPVKLAGNVPTASQRRSNYARQFPPPLNDDQIVRRSFCASPAAIKSAASVLNQPVQFLHLQGGGHQIRTLPQTARA